MTREEAIEALGWGECNDPFWREDYKIAINMAIEALKQPEIVHCEDCKWFVEVCHSKYPEDRYCSYDNSNFSTNPEGFCYRGDRRDSMMIM